MRKYRRSRIRYVGFIAAAILATLFVIDYATRDEYVPPGQRPITDTLITTAYPKLYKAIYQRSAAEVHPFLQHDSELIRRQAWQAMASTAIDSMAEFIERVEQSSLEEAWFALSMHPLSDEELSTLKQSWIDNPGQRRGISQVLGRQGNEKTLRFLLRQQEEASGSAYEYDYALAVGRLLTEFEVPSAARNAIIARAFEVEDESVTRAYLYGFYRGSNQNLAESNRDSLYKHWRLYGVGNDAGIDQYIAKILGQQVLYEITMYYNSEELLERQVQLAVELAQTLDGLELTSNYALAAKILVIHPNPIVVQQTLQSLNDKLSEDDHLFSYISGEILDSEQVSSVVWLAALETAAKVNASLVDKHADRLKNIRDTQPYMLPQILAIHRISDTPEEYVNLIRSIMAESDPLAIQFALQALADYWTEFASDQRNERLTQNLRKSILGVLGQGDRGVAYAAGEILAFEDLFGPQDFEQINQKLNTFQLPEDIEVFQVFGTLYKKHFEQQASSVVDSLAALDYAPLNRTLKQAGWDVQVPEDRGSEFRSPDWRQLWQLGRNPVWTLVTEKGTIRVRLDVLSAPATISAIDKLTRSGAYNGVPFHRVVPNFVIQGGDIERGDGFGGPDFILPTEASAKEFKRGATGIASAGTDTEGSQYFFMHQWSPHLNGRYTLLGEVIEGMEVVDQITVGDQVERVYWE